LKIYRRQALVGGAAIAATRCGGSSTAATRDHAQPSVGDAAVVVPTTPDASSPTVFSAPGRVIEVKHSGSVVAGQIQAQPVQQILTRAILELTGATSEAAAWASMFSPDDVVAIKVNPFGYPKFYSHPETVASILRGLNLVGIPNENVIIYDRYTDFLAQVGYDTALPGVQLASATLTTDAQTNIVAYDTTKYVEFPKVDVNLDPNVVENRRSYLSSVISKQATKVINVPVVKSHYTAGVTAALKNMTYGLVNNTARTHYADGSDNWTIDFLPAVASMPQLRSKVVLHVVDLLVGCYDKGPDPSDATFDYASLLLATDPVAVDRICWNIVDAARASNGLPPVADFPGAEPQYIIRCGDLGLGIADLNAIDHQSFVLG
jgi:uncharacterized protein (DUF362 family)